MKECTICKYKKLESCFNKNKARKDGLQTKCKDCSKKLSKLYYENTATNNKEKIQKRNKQRLEEARAFVLGYLKNNPCIDCGESDPIVLEFDHVRGDKRNAISSLMNYSLTAIKNEIEKCEVRCANCHRKKTAKENSYYRWAIS